jgi:hypothetical protein
MDGSPPSDSIDRLPDDLLVLILMWLPWAERVAARAVSRRWLGVIDTAPHLWQESITDRDSIFNEFVYRCYFGDLARLQWFATAFGVADRDVRSDCRGALYKNEPYIESRPRLNAFHITCARGNLEKVQWLVSTFGLLAGDACPFGIREACAHGRLHVAAWLATTFDLTAADMRSAGCLHVACAGGHLSTVRWLVTQFGLDADDVCPETPHDTCALQATCAGRHLASARWLADNFRLQPPGDHAVAMLMSACYLRRLGLARWIVWRFGVTAEDARSGDNALLRSTCSFGGRVFVARWLVARFGLGADDARARNNELLRISWGCGYLEFVKFLVKDLGLTAADAEMAIAASGGNLRSGGSLKAWTISHWLANQFGWAE